MTDDTTSVTAKHAKWQDALINALKDSECLLSRVLLGPATRLNALETALYVSRIPLKEVVTLPSHVRKLVIRFQRRASAVGLVDNLPELLAVARRSPAMLKHSHAAVLKPPFRRRGSPLSKEGTRK